MAATKLDGVRLANQDIVAARRGSSRLHGSRSAAFNARRRLAEGATLTCGVRPLGDQLSTGGSAQSVGAMGRIQEVRHFDPLGICSGDWAK